MSDKLERVRKQLHTSLDATVDSLEATRNHFQAKTTAAEADIRTRLDASKAKVAGMQQQQAAAARARMNDLVNAKVVETDAQVAEWRAKRQQDQLDRRADLAEDYAVACMAMTMAMAAEADQAVLEATLARMDANLGTA